MCGFRKCYFGGKNCTQVVTSWFCANLSDTPVIFALEFFSCLLPNRNLFLRAVQKEQIFTDQVTLMILYALSPVIHFSWCSINKSTSQIKNSFPFPRMCWAVDLQFLRWGQNNICWRTISILAWTATIFEILNFS